MQQEKVLIFNKDIYTIDCIQKAAYRNLVFFSIDIELQDKKIICNLKQNINIEKISFLKAIEDFQADIVDYSLREKIYKETEDVRNLILGVAFSNTELISE